MYIYYWRKTAIYRNSCPNKRAQSIGVRYPNAKHLVQKKKNKQLYVIAAESNVSAQILVIYQGLSLINFITYF